MTDWCYNKLTVMGSKENLKVFKDQVRGKETDICFNNLVPMPKELDNILFQGENHDLCDWRIRNWGVKWDVNAHIVDESEDALVYEFKSASIPPNRWIGKVALIFPDLSFKLCYKENNTCFQGTIIAQKDLLIDEEEDYFEEMDVPDEECELCDEVLTIISIARRE